MSAERERDAAPSPSLVGVAYAVASFAFWGLSPLFWKPISHIAAPQILAHRVLWSIPVVLLLITLRGQWPEVRAVFSDRRTVAALVLSATLVGINWGIFIWAMAADRILEASLGYYINPLVSVFLGFALLRERLRVGQWIAVGLAATAVAILTVRFGSPPWIAILLAFSFGCYGLIRKVVRAGPIVGVTIEIALLTPVAALFMSRWRADGSLQFTGESTITQALLLLAGVVTITPLIWFSQGARRLRLATLGLLQFLAPTLQFLLAVLKYGEPFTRTHLVAFGLIWTALAVYTIEGRRNR
jgi:chloramphenicol-sensitive protein RarD